MARIQALRQQHFLESSSAPISSSSVTGYAASGKAPLMHPFKSSNPVFKATSLIHSFRVKKAKIAGFKGINLGSGLHLPRLHI